MERLRDVLNGHWEGKYTERGVSTQMDVVANLSPDGQSLGVTGSGRDGYGAFTLTGSATSTTEIFYIKNLGLFNEWWHRVTVDVDNKQMNGKWGPKINFNAVHGSIVLNRQITEAERQQEVQAEMQRQAEEVRQREEAAAAIATQKQQEDEAAMRRKQEAEEAARKKQEEEDDKAAAAAATTKQREEAESARKRAEETEAATAAKKEREAAEVARETGKDAEAAGKKVQGPQNSEKPGLDDVETRRKEDPARKGEDDAGQKQQPEVTHGPQITGESKNPVASNKDSEDKDDIAGTLKVHLKLALDADIRVIAALKGDIAIGIL